jgi:amino acid permease
MGVCLFISFVCFVIHSFVFNKKKKKKNREIHMRKKQKVYTFEERGEG